MPQEIASANVVASKLYGGASNEYYAEDRKRTVTIKIVRNVEGLYRVTAGTIYGGNHLYGSGIIANEADAREDANRVWSFVRDHLTGQHKGLPTDRVPFDTSGLSFCPSCDRYNTLTSKQLPYGDLTECGAADCDYSRYYSIGD